MALLRGDLVHSREQIGLRREGLTTRITTLGKIHIVVLSVIIKNQTQNTAAMFGLRSHRPFISVLPSRRAHGTTSHECIVMQRHHIPLLLDYLLTLKHDNKVTMKGDEIYTLKLKTNFTKD